MTVERLLLALVVLAPQLAVTTLLAALQAPDAVAIAAGLAAGLAGGWPLAHRMENR